MSLQCEWLEVNSRRQNADDVPWLKLNNLVMAYELNVRGIVVENASETSRRNLGDAHPHALHIRVTVDWKMKHQLRPLANSDVLPIPLVRQLERLGMLLLKLDSINQPELGCEILHGCDSTTQERPGARDATIATATLPPG